MEADFVLEAVVRSGTASDAIGLCSQLLRWGGGSKSCGERTQQAFPPKSKQPGARGGAGNPLVVSCAAHRSRCQWGGDARAFSVCGRRATVVAVSYSSIGGERAHPVHCCRVPYTAVVALAQLSGFNPTGTIILEQNSCTPLAQH